jgi:hypothetical protein
MLEVELAHRHTVHDKHWNLPLAVVTVKIVEGMLLACCLQLVLRRRHHQVCLTREIGSEFERQDKQNYVLQKLLVKLEDVLTVNDGHVSILLSVARRSRQHIAKYLGLPRLPVCV